MTTLAEYAEREGLPLRRFYVRIRLTPELLALVRELETPKPDAFVRAMHDRRTG